MCVVIHRECCCTARRERARRCWRVRWRTTRTARSFACPAPSSCKSTSARARAWSASSSSWHGAHIPVRACALVRHLRLAPCRCLEVARRREGRLTTYGANHSVSALSVAHNNRSRNEKRGDAFCGGAVRTSETSQGGGADEPYVSELCAQGTRAIHHLHGRDRLNRVRTRWRWRRRR